MKVNNVKASLFRSRLNQNYGYAFRFAKNGDGSPVSGEQDISTDFGN